MYQLLLILWLALTFSVFGYFEHTPPKKKPFLYKDSVFVGEVNLDVMKRKLLDNEQKTPTIVVLYAPWCPHCRKYVKTFEGIAEKFIHLASLFSASAKITNWRDYPNKHVEFLAVNCVDEKETCEYFDMCNSKREEFVALNRGTADSTGRSSSIYTEDGCGYPSILSFNFGNGECTIVWRAMY